jgi:putative transposase
MISPAYAMRRVVSMTRTDPFRQWLQNTDTRRFNVRHRRGAGCSVRYKAVLVEGAGYYYETLLDYVHLNPARAGFADRCEGQSVLDYAWSSVSGGQALAPRRRPPWLAAQDALWAFGFEDTAAGRRRWVERLDDRARAELMEKCGIPARREEDDARRSDLRRGWYWGSQAFAERMLRIGEPPCAKPAAGAQTRASKSRRTGSRKPRSKGILKRRVRPAPASRLRDKVQKALAVNFSTVENFAVLAAQNPRRMQ